MRWQYVPVMLLVLALLAVPASAQGAKYLYGNPELSATIAGTNEFAPGTETGLTVIIANNGLNTIKMVGSTIITPDDLPNTAKLATAALKSEGTPFTVKTDPQFLSDIMGGASRTATFNVKVADSAEPGTYVLPLEVTYTYLQDAEDLGDTLRYNYQKKTETLPLSVRVTPDLRVEVLDIRSESLNVGTEGYVSMTLKNIGSDPAENAIAK
ncbi:COG1361 S-layer family protein, partial [Methanoculleus sp.]|nr:S-layer protein [Methanoculleus sp.]